MIKNIHFFNNLVTLEDIKISQYVYGPSIADIKGNAIFNKTLQVKIYIIKIPETINNMHRNVTLYFDFFF